MLVSDPSRKRPAKVLGTLRLHHDSPSGSADLRTGNPSWLVASRRNEDPRRDELGLVGAVV